MSSCSEESLTSVTQDSTVTTADIETFQLNTCSQMTFEKPPVDILYIVDNSGSTLASSFQDIKGQIQNTIFNISNDFDYHIYIAPLNAGPTDSIQGYPLLVSDPSTIPSLASVNLTQPENLSFFAQASGNNKELGIERAKNLIEFNRSNGIFRNSANTIVVMISNGDDTQAEITLNGNQVFDPGIYTTMLNDFKKFTRQYANSNSVTNPLNAESLRFISLVPHSNCSGWKTGTNYKRLSQDLYNFQSFTDDLSSSKDSVDLCSRNYSTLFSAVNNSIKAIVIGHKYDHWKISSANETDIQANDITLTRLKSDGSSEIIPPGTTNGFEYLGFQTNINTRYEPTVGEPATGLMVKLNGSARVEYPDCLIAKTRTPTEYFGFVTVPREPDLSTVKIEVRGQNFPQSDSQGWTYLGWRDTINIKVPGPENTSVTPPVNKTGYVFQLHGDAIYSNGETVKVFYKPKGK